jgi:uncharacterized protein (TIGR02001 family)
MKKLLAIGIVAVFFGLGWVQGAVAADVSVASALNSAYVWRGITLNDGVVFQPSVDVSKGGFGLNVWGNMDLDDYNDQLDSGQFSEIDLTLRYSFDVDPVNISLGYIEYLYPATDAGGLLGTREVYLSLGMDIIENLSAGLNCYYDFDEIEDYYLNFSLGYNIPLNDVVGLDLKAAAGYAGKEYAKLYGKDDKAGFFDYLLTLGVNYTISESLSLTASVNYTDAFDKDTLANGDFAQDVNTFGGINVSYSF